MASLSLFNIEYKVKVCSQYVKWQLLQVDFTNNLAVNHKKCLVQSSNIVWSIHSSFIYNMLYISITLQIKNKQLAILL